MLSCDTVCGNALMIMVQMSSGGFFCIKREGQFHRSFQYTKSYVDVDVVFDVSFSRSIRHCLLLISVRVDFPLTSKAGDGFFIPS